MPARKIRFHRVQCNQCGQCVELCPVSIFRIASPGSPPKITDQRRCISCGYCVMVCATGAIQHIDFPREDFILLDLPRN